MTLKFFHFCRRFRFRHLIVGVCLLLFSSAALFFFALSPYAFREIWLPLAAKSAGVSATAESLYLESLFPFRLRVVNLHYSDPETTIHIHSAVSRLRTGQLKKHAVVLHDTRIDGIQIICHPPKPRPKTVRPAIEKPMPRQVRKDEDEWTFSMKNFRMKDASLIIRNQEGKSVQIWSAQSLEGDLFQTEKNCSLTADASVTTQADKRNPISIRSLPFRLQAQYQMDKNFRLKEFQIALQTGICDLSITNEIVIPAQAGISASLRLKGSFPAPDSFRIVHSETRLFKAGKNIGKLLFKGTFGDLFQCEGTFSDLDMQPYLSILVPDYQVRMIVPQASFTASGSDFSRQGIQRDLKTTLTAELKQFSIPIELNRKSRILRLIMIPVEAVPTYLEVLEMKWNLRNEIDHCLDSIKAIISGKQNLNFDQAKINLALEHGTLNIKEITLHGKDIEMETIQGKLDIATEKMDIQTVLILNGIKIPLRFKGTLNRPSPRFRDALKNFMLLNAPLLKKLENLLTQPPSPEDSKLEKAIKRGYRDLNRFLQ